MSQTTKRVQSNERMLATGGEARIEAYSFSIIDAGGVTWERGNSYGFEFAETQLPHNFIFGSSYSSSASSPVKDVAVLRFVPGGNSGSGATGGIVGGQGTVQVSSLRPDATGSLAVLPVATTRSPEGRRATE